MRRQGAELSKADSFARNAKPKWSEWLVEALGGLKPPERLTVSQWADRNRILDSRTSAIDGPWRTWRTEYLRGVMDAFTDPEVEELWLCKPAQFGGTEAIYNILGYVIEQDPGPAMFVYPDEKSAKRMSKTRIQPMIQACPALRAKLIDSESEDLELHFIDMTLILAWAGSPAAVAAAPCRYVFLDEVGKYPSRAGNEATRSRWLTTGPRRTRARARLSGRRRRCWRAISSTAGGRWPIRCCGTSCPARTAAKRRS